MISLTQSAGLDLIKHRINVNAIAPGVVDNEHWDNVDSLFARYEGLEPGEKKRQVGAAVPFGRMARPDEIGGLATFLASTDADYIVAQTYNIDGGIDELREEKARALPSTRWGLRPQTPIS